MQAPHVGSTPPPQGRLLGLRLAWSERLFEVKQMDIHSL